MARRHVAPVAPVAWRDGVHLTGTPIWCDARRRQNICFVSSVDAVEDAAVRGRAARSQVARRATRSAAEGRREGQLIGTPSTLALVAAKGDGHLAVPPRQRFTLGTVRLQLIPTGHGLGAAALHADIAGHSVMYAGAVRTTSGGLGEAAEVRSCEALVVAAPYGEKHHAFPPLARTIDETAAWARLELATERRPVLFVDTLLAGLEIAAALAARDVPVAASRVLREAATRAAAFAPLPAISSVGKEPRAIVWLDDDHAGLRRALGQRRFATALVSGRALDAGGPERSGYDAAFAWADAADRAQLLGWIESANAKQVFVTGACAEAIATTLGARARVIGPPHQMALFDVS